MDLRTTRTIRSVIEIRASQDVVWGVLTDFATYPEWNPLMRRVRGRPRTGGRLIVRSQPPGGRAIINRPRLLAWDPPREFRWRAVFFSPRVFRGEHGFRLEAIDHGRVRFVQDETFSGWLVPIYSIVRLPAMREGFAAMNEALRDRAEKLAP